MTVVIKSDAVVAAQFADGDAESVRDLYQRFSGLVYSVTYKVLGDAALAQDAAPVPQPATPHFTPREPRKWHTWCRCVVECSAGGYADGGRPTRRQRKNAVASRMKPLVGLPHYFGL